MTQFVIIKKNLHSLEETQTKFDWFEEIKNLCVKKENNEIFLDKLEKKLYKKHKKHSSQDDEEIEGRCKSGHDQEESVDVVNADQFKKKLNKKLKKLQNTSTISLISYNDDQSIIVVKYLNDDK